MLESPILFLVFNREKETKIVFEAIRRQKPCKLFVAADGPRLDKNGEYEKCNKVRNWILENINWPCEVRTLFREKNLGCGRAVSEAITWFFSNVDQGIILEDDCLPGDSFFGFCNELLEKYKDNMSVSAISGNNFQPYPMSLDPDYYFSIFPSSWGWATWKRSWEGYELHISKWNHMNRRRFLGYLFREKRYQKWWADQFDSFYERKSVDTWDFQFHFLSMMRQQLAIIPRVNLVSNIGYGSDGTHIHGPDSPLINIPIFELNFPLTHPAYISRNYGADVFVQNLVFGEIEISNPIKRAKQLAKRLTN